MRRAAEESGVQGQQAQGKVSPDEETAEGTGQTAEGGRKPSG